MFYKLVLKSCHNSHCTVEARKANSCKVCSCNIDSYVRSISDMLLKAHCTALLGSPLRQVLFACPSLIYGRSNLLKRVKIKKICAKLCNS